MKNKILVLLMQRMAKVAGGNITPMDYGRIEEINYLIREVLAMTEESRP